MDTTVEVATPSPPAPAPATMLTLPLSVTLARFRPIQVVLVGAGGTGARLGPDIARLLSRGDRLIIIDPDRVEDHNLTRQHFVRANVGQYKAEVVGKRAQQVVTGGVEVETRITSLENIGDVQNITDQFGTRIPSLWVGAVDTRKCRRMAAAQLLNKGTGLWIDVGNELRGGQVGMMGSWLAESVVDPMGGLSFPTKQQQATIEEYVRNGHQRGPMLFKHGTWVAMNTIAEITPAILQPNVEEEAKTLECPIRIDGQSLAANVMAYASVINIVSRILDGLDISVGASFFSTNNTMLGKPFMHLGGDTVGGTQLALGVERRFASMTDLTTYINEVVRAKGLLAGAGATTPVRR